MNKIDFVIYESGELRSYYPLISELLIISRPRHSKINFQAWVWFETAHSIYSRVYIKIYQEVT